MLNLLLLLYHKTILKLIHVNIFNFLSFSIDILSFNYFSEWHYSITFLTGCFKIEKLIIFM
jgi:hypothetical protein